MKYLIILLSFSLVACGGEETSQVVPEENINQGTGDVGPFALKLSNNQTLEQNSFSIEIDQKEGKVEYHLAPSNMTQWMKIRSFQTSVTGCDSSQVQLSLFWQKEAQASTQVINKGQYFSSGKETKGILTAFFQNIGSCQTLSFKLIVDHIIDPQSIPKNWTTTINPNLLGVWENESKGVRIDIQNSYLTFESSKFQLCIQGYGRAKIDETQTPHFLGTVSDDELLCEYQYSGQNLHLHCPQSPDWDCPELPEMTLKRR